MLPNIKLLSLSFVFVLMSCQVTPNKPTQLELTKTFTPASVPTVTPVFTNTPVAETVVFEENMSPNGEWTGVVSVTTRDTQKNVNFIVVNNINNQKWTLEDINFLEPDNPLNGFKYPYVFMWSKDGRYMYYSHLSMGGDGCFGHFKPGGSDLIKFDLLLGIFVVIKEDSATWMALSPDEEKLAFVDMYGGNVSVLDIQKGITASFPLPDLEDAQGYYNDTSDIYWSPEGDSLVYAYYIGVCDFIYPASYIIQVFPESNYQKILIENSEESYEPVKWDIEDKILLEDYDNKQWWLDVTTKEISPVNN
ncbi:MAG TPA: hypothetical protein PKJ84_11140 [Anaerolineales bacterium]|nr:hypothetical protein [Anaerolineales bacterium]HNO94719.1 hypothetical protein [Anaerolineales bacterium]